MIGNVCRQRVEQRRLSRSGTARDQDVPLSADRGSKSVSHDRREGADLYQFTERESRCELSDSQNWPGDGAWRKHRGYPRAVLEARVEQWLHVGDLVAAGARDVLDRDGEIPRFQHAVRHALQAAVALNENALSALVHHHFGDPRIDEEILDRPQERQYAIKAAHNAPRDRWSK